MELNLIKSNKKELSRTDLIEELGKEMINNADGENIIGDGKNLVNEGGGVIVTHEFTDGVYIRRMDLQKGSVVVSAVHKQKHVWFLMSGNVTVADKNGIQDYQAPCYTISQPGTQRVINANEDSIWINCHKNPTDTEDLDFLEKEMVAMSVKEYEQSIKNK